jgi:hypothetical protein
MGSCPTDSERIPTPEPKETVVFYDHFPGGFALPASSFLHQFLDQFHLQPHHLGANAMMMLATFVALCEAYLGIWPNIELFCRLIYFKTQTAETIPVVCGMASFYARKTVAFPGLKGKESCKKWQRSFFYVKNLKEGADHINLPPFDAKGPERDNWSAPLPSAVPDVEKILQRISVLQKDGGLKPHDLLLAFLVARVSPLQRRSHKMCFLGSARDPTRHSSKELSATEVARKANRVADVKLRDSWKWGLKPYDRYNLITEVRLPGLVSVSPPLRFGSSDFYLSGSGRTYSLCRPQRTQPNIRLALPLIGRSRTTGSFGTTLRRTRRSALAPPSGARVPPMAMKEVKSSWTRASPSTTPVSFQVTSP